MCRCKTNLNRFYDTVSKFPCQIKNIENECQSWKHGTPQK